MGPRFLAIQIVHYIVHYTALHSALHQKVGPHFLTRVAKRWELNTVLIVNTNNRTTVGLANNTGQH